MILRKALRVAAIVGVVGASAYVSASANAAPLVTFTECSLASPSIPPEPTLTAPPIEGGDPTPPSQPEATPPPQHCMPSSGERIWGTRTLQFSVQKNGARTIDNVQLWIFSQEQNIPSAANGTAFTPVQISDTSTASTFSFDWNSVEATPYNGIYKVVVRARAVTPRAIGGPFTQYTCPDPTTNQNPPNSTAKCTERVNLLVDNAPGPVEAPKILATTLGSVTMQWQLGPEPDITAYSVYRATTNSASERPLYTDFRLVGATTGAAFRDSTVQPGTQWYFVRVTRRSVVTPDQGISSPASAMSSPAVIDSPKPTDAPNSGGKPDTPTRFIPYRQLAPARPQAVVRAIPDAPFAYKLPYDNGSNGSGDSFGNVENGSSATPSDPRGAVLPVAVGMFLVSSALAVGRMPY